ncbi:MAG TPA: FAD-dependent oxidoreductase [Symbiobacteriaceae bacterium]|nr:FAD-dependent oxidoreductase [Symbiobacteriaceae bacterium]
MEFNMHGSAGEYDVIIIGGGPGGATAALYSARADLRTLVLDKSLAAGALGMTTNVDNYPGMPNSTGPEIVRTIRGQAEDFGAEFRQEQVIGVSFDGEVKEIYSAGGTYRGQTVILATGGMGRSSFVPGEEALVGKGVSYCATCDAAFFRDQEVAVVGTGEQAAEEALFLTKFASKVTLVHAGKAPKAAPELLAQLKDEPKVFFLSGRLTAVLGDGKVSGIRVAGANGDEDLVVTGVFIFLQGNKPVIDYLMGAVPVSESGCLLVNRETFETEIPGVFAIGDLLCTEIKQAVIAASEGCQAAIHAEKKLRGRKKALRDWK